MGLKLSVDSISNQLVFHNKLASFTGGKRAGLLHAALNKTSSFFSQKKKLLQAAKKKLLLKRLAVMQLQQQFYQNLMTEKAQKTFLGVHYCFTLR